jgi:hypothetical protein
MWTTLITHAIAILIGAGGGVFYGARITTAVKADIAAIKAKVGAL